MGSRISFHGAARTVTGSRHLLTLDGKKVLVDCGLFQGPREIRERNWHPFPIEPSDLDAVVITHAHTDHIGYLPRLVAQGYRGPIYSTSATAALARISLPDSGRIQEEDARQANKHGRSRHQPALPLYTEKDAFECLKQFERLPFHEFVPLPGRAQFRYLHAGHILGSAFAEIYFQNGERILMSGDLGRFGTPIIKDPERVDFAEYLVLESTYGDRTHSEENVLDRLETLIREGVAQGSAIVVPSFAIGRTQELLYALRQLQDQGRIPRIPIFIDSPMATSTTRLYLEHREEHDLEMSDAMGEQNPLQPDLLTFIRDREESKALNVRSGPMMIIAGSGMASGGRIVHHLKQRLRDPSTIVLFTGYQAEGTLGREILEGNATVEIHREFVEVNARIEKLNSLSAHADQSEILRWLSGFSAPPKRTFLVHGEPRAQDALKAKIEEVHGWDVVIPRHGEGFDL